MDNNKILEQLQESAKDIEIPAHLTPNRIQERVQGKSPKDPYEMSKAVIELMKYAAVIVVFVGIFTMMVSPIVKSNQKDQISPSNDYTEAMTDEGIEVACGKLDVKKVIGSAREYGEIYRNIDILNDTRKEMGEYTDGGMEEIAGSTMDQSAEKSESSAAELPTTGASENSSELESSTEFSDTNVQVEGVAEGDIVKTDGTYIYSLSNEKLMITKAENGQLERQGFIPIKNSENNITEMYVITDKLVIIQQMENTSFKEDIAERAMINPDLDIASTVETVVSTYNIKDKKNPKLIASINQEGQYTQSRIKDGYLYVFTDVYKQTYDYAKNEVIVGSEDIAGYVPSINGKPVDAEQIMIPQQIDNESYMMVSSIHLENPDQVVDTRSVLSGCRRIYVSNDNIYLELYSNYNNYGASKIVKFSYKNGKIVPVAAGAVKGETTDDFAYDEYNGYLRVVTTSWSGGNNLYVLDEQLNVEGSIEGLAPGETIKSARFMGDIGYFVTFRETDPLFSVDLKDTKNPKILGELKITGFSEYLHFYGENRLLGIGEEVDPNSGIRQGIKLSMFDTTDPHNVVELHKIIVPGIQSTTALYNYKSVMINPEKNIIGFNGEDTSVEYGQGANYLVYGYEEGVGFVSKFQTKATIENPQYPGDGSLETVRGLYIGQYLYVTNKSQITSYDMNNSYQKVALLP